MVQTRCQGNQDSLCYGLGHQEYTAGCRVQEGPDDVEADRVAQRDREGVPGGSMEVEHQEGPTSQDL